MTVEGTDWRELLVKAIREPLAHFLVIGALLFALLSGRPPDAGERRIVVNEAIATRLVDRWEQAFRRQPSPAEIDGLIREYVRDQVYYREALRLGLDRDDEVVIKRMRNKLVAMASSETSATEPSDAQLQALIDANPARYTGESRFTLTQVYLGDTAASAPSVLAQLRGGADPARLGMPAPLPQHFTNTPASDLAERFGEDFPAALGSLQTGVWSGPVASGLGHHVVRLERRDAGAAPRLQDVRQRATNDWHAAANAAAEEADYQRLLQGYAVTIERPRG